MCTRSTSTGCQSVSSVPGYAGRSTVVQASAPASYASTSRVAVSSALVGSSTIIRIKPSSTTTLPVKSCAVSNTRPTRRRRPVDRVGLPVRPPHAEGQRRPGASNRGRTGRPGRRSPSAVASNRSMAPCSASTVSTDTGRSRCVGELVESTIRTRRASAGMPTIASVSLPNGWPGSGWLGEVSTARTYAACASRLVRG